MPTNKDYGIPIIKFRCLPQSELEAASRRNREIKRPRGRPQYTPLDEHKDLILKLVLVDDIPIVDVAKRMNLEYGLDISERTISRRLRVWKVPRRRDRNAPTDDLRDRIMYYYNKNYSDEEMAEALKVELGYKIKVRKLGRLRQKLGMKRRSKFPGYGEGPVTEEGDDSSEEINTEEQEQEPIPASSPKPKKTAAITALIPKVTAFVQEYMSKYDGSHDFEHIKRVVGLAQLIYKELKSQRWGAEGLDLHVITLAALLHDVGDKKYLEPGQDGNTLVLATLLGFGAPEELAIKVQRIVLGVSYSSEIKDPAHVRALIVKYPELAIVQDADRLDAVGAVGIGRTFTFGGAKGGRHMGETIEHFGEKLEKLEAMMKTVPGKRLAKERTERLKIFRGWWEEEQKEAREYFAGMENRNVLP